jgi:hypothetical protein
MSQQRVLVCYYSMTGNTRRLAKTLGRALDAEIEELHESNPRRGLKGLARTVLDSVRQRTTALAPIHHDPAQVDLLVLGGPIWSGRLAAPVLAYAGGPGRHAARVAFFCTRARRGPDRAFAELEQLCGRTRVASLAIQTRRMARASAERDIARFVAAVRRGMGQPLPLTTVDTWANEPEIAT